jgi:hypothetical protein
LSSSRSPASSLSSSRREHELAARELVLRARGRECELLVAAREPREHQAGLDARSLADLEGSDRAVELEGELDRPQRADAP